MRLGIVTLVAVLAAAIGCYRTYTGSYYLPEWVVKSPCGNRSLREVVETAIRPFGFEEVEGQPAGYFLYINNQEDPVERRRVGRVRVGIDTIWPRVLVGDLDHDYETPFVRSVKDAIEKQLKAECGLTEFRFVRHFDLLT